MNLCLFGFFAHVGDFQIVGSCFILSKVAEVSKVKQFWRVWCWLADFLLALPQDVMKLEIVDHGVELACPLKQVL